MESLVSSLSRTTQLLLAFVGAVAFGVTMQSLFPGNTLGSGVSAEQAISGADTSPYTDATFVSARLGLLRDFESPDSSTAGHENDEVWALLYTGSFPFPSCGPPGGTCPEPAHTMMIFVDYHSGDELFTEMPAPVR